MKLLRFVCLLLLCALCLPSIACYGYRNDEEHRVFACGNRAEKALALTFDDGPHPVYTDEIREILAKYDIKATFFVIGQNAEYYPEPLKRLIADGHAIGNHTYKHPSLNKQSEAELMAELRKNAEVLSGFGVTPTLFRPPAGVCEEKVIAAANRANCDIILWTIDTEDWKALPPERIAQTVIENVRGGDIILMHDYVDHSNTPAALRILLPALIEEGYRFVTVEELIGSRCTDQSGR